MPIARIQRSCPSRSLVLNVSCVALQRHPYPSSPWPRQSQLVQRRPYRNAPQPITELMEQEESLGIIQAWDAISAQTKMVAACSSAFAMSNMGEFVHPAGKCLRGSPQEKLTGAPLLVNTRQGQYDTGRCPNGA